MKTAYITHNDCLLHDNGITHLESADRLISINYVISNSNLKDKLIFIEAKDATKEQLLRAHSLDYINFIENSKPNKLTDKLHLDVDTQMSYYSYNAAKKAAGAAVEAVDLVLKNKVKNVFCAVRPPGHHAKYNQAMGFCIFNNIMVAIKHALDKYKLSRIALIDFDVHHGNGSENIINNDERILFCSSFQHPFYPGEPFQNNNHIICNPLSAGSGSSEFRDIVENVWIEKLHKFKPQLIFISAGFDAHKDDFLANLNFTTDDYYWVSKKLVTIAKKYTDSHIISSLEGGYNTKALAESVKTHIKALTE